MTLLVLTRPLVCLDVESTGVSPKLDRICQIGLVKLYPDGTSTEWKTYVNPGIPIPAEATTVHLITNGMVADSPVFNSKEVAGVLSTGLLGCDLAGFNQVSFDIEILKEEFGRSGIDPVKTFAGAKFVDVFRIFQRFEPRTLSAAAAFYLGEKHEGAHDALADVRMTLRVLESQLARYKLPSDVSEIHKLLFETVREGHVDPEGKIVLRNGVPVLNFSKHAGTPISQLDLGFMRWALRQNFNDKIREVFTAELRRRG